MSALNNCCRCRRPLEFAEIGKTWFMPDRHPTCSGCQDLAERVDTCLAMARFAASEQDWDRVGQWAYAAFVSTVTYLSLLTPHEEAGA
jgi:hypothetical protein